MIEDMRLRNYSPKTIGLYVAHLAKFADFAGKGLNRVTREEVRDYLVYLVEVRGIKWGVYNQVVAAMRFLFRHVLHRGEIVEDIRCAKAEKRLPVVLALEEMSRFFAAIHNFKHRAILMTAYGAGLRISEAVNLRIADIDSQRMVIRVEHGKGGKDRYVMLSPQLLRILRTYWRLTRPKRWLFPGRDDERPLVPNVLHAACRSACAAAGLSKQVTVHTLRHTFATHLLESGADVRIIQVLLGHASLSSTARYTRVATKTISNTPSPLDRLRLEVVPPG
jgi:site-specific recombinase XerD